MSESITSLQYELASANSSRNYWRGRAGDLETKAIDMQRVARSLEGEVGRLNNLFLPIRHVHNASTWQGNAATLSRQRLDAHEARFSSAITMLNGVITELGGAATENIHKAAAARSNESHHRRRARSLVLEINAAQASPNLYS